MSEEKLVLLICLEILKSNFPDEVKISLLRELILPKIVCSTVSPKISIENLED